MADDITGGTQPGGNPGQTGVAPEPEQKNIEAEFQKRIEDAEKRGREVGRTESYRHFQSIADKQIAEVKEQAKKEVISEMKREQLKSLDPDERYKAMVEEVYNKMFEGTTTVPEKLVTPSPETNVSVDDGVEEARKKISATLEKRGVDTSKINWGDGLDPGEAIGVFIDSITSQKRETKPQEEPLMDTSRSASGVMDILKADPVDIIRRGAGRVRGTFN